MWVLQGDLKLVAVSLQRVEEVIGEPTCTGTTAKAWKTADGPLLPHAASLLPPVARLTQLLAAEAQTGRVLVEVLVEVDAQAAQLLLDGLDLLQEVEEEENKDQSELALLWP